MPGQNNDSIQGQLKSTIGLEIKEFFKNHWGKIVIAAAVVGVVAIAIFAPYLFAAIGLGIIAVKIAAITGFFGSVVPGVSSAIALAIAKGVTMAASGLAALGITAGVKAVWNGIKKYIDKGQNSSSEAKVDDLSKFSQISSDAKTTQLLQQQGHKPVPTNEQIEQLHQAIKSKGKVEITRADFELVMAKDMAGDNALHLAIKHRREDVYGRILDLFYTKKELINAQNGEGNTALHLAADAFNLPLVIQLHDVCGADTYIYNNEQQTILNLVEFKYQMVKPNSSEEKILDEFWNMLDSKGKQQSQDNISFSAPTSHP